MKAPAFQFYAADFLADKNVAVMGAEEVGAYILLLSYCWREGSLPNDVEELSALARIPLDRFQASWDKRIRRCFNQAPGGDWVHPRLEEERRKQAENREKKQMAANKRHHPEGAAPPPPPAAPSTRNADAMQAHCPSSSTSTANTTNTHSNSPRAGSVATSSAFSHEVHPAVQVYREVFGKDPPAFDQDLMARDVSDLTTWRGVCEQWKGNKNFESKVWNMIDRYKKLVTGEGRHGKPDGRSAEGGRRDNTPAGNGGTGRRDRNLAELRRQAAEVVVESSPSTLDRDFDARPSYKAGSG